MQRTELEYVLPPDLIAQHAVEPRDAARLLVVDRASGRIEHRVFHEIGEYLEPGDCLVINNTRVIPARFFCRRSSGGRIEGLFLHPEGDGWRVLLKPGRRLKAGEPLALEGCDMLLRIVSHGQRGEWLVRPEPPADPLVLLGQIGQTPLPPYIRRDGPEPGDVGRYQTVYAMRAGAVAAPTAGLHFTDKLLDRLANCGVRRIEVTLHIGAGTFTPIEADDLAEHCMHAEWFEVTPQAADALRGVRRSGGRIVAVGTTAARVLESLPEPGQLAAASGWTDVFIYPPYRFRLVDRLITNFHLPGSTLLALVMAFASRELILQAYEEAIAERYRFYSYGDAMLIL